MKAILMTLCALVLVACTDPPMTPQQSVATSCAAVAAAVRVLTEADRLGKLQPEARTRVLQALTITDPVCRSPTAPTLQEAEIAAFNAALTTLQTEAGNEH